MPAAYAEKNSEPWDTLRHLMHTPAPLTSLAAHCSLRLLTWGRAWQWQWLALAVAWQWRDGGRSGVPWAGRGELNPRRYSRVLGLARGLPEPTIMNADVTADVQGIIQSQLIQVPSGHPDGSH